ncbi:MAG: ABC transporter permease [Candidatus Limnocylindrales bacterium]
MAGEFAVRVAPAAGPWWARMGTRGRAVLVGVEFVVIFGLWQIGVGVLGLISPVFLPPPLSVLDGLGQMAISGELWSNLAYSSVSYGVGYLLAVTVGVGLGLLIGSSFPANKLMGPILWSIYATPFLAYRPLSIVWFGFGLPPIIFIVFMASVFPVLFNTAAGVRATEPSLINASRVFGLGRLGRYRKIILPSTLPYVLTGMRQSVVMAMIGLLVAEMTGSPTGIGALITIKTGTYRTDEAFAAILVAVVATVLLGRLVEFVTARLAPWQADMTAVA